MGYRWLLLSVLAWVLLTVAPAGAEEPSDAPPKRPAPRGAVVVAATPQIRDAAKSLARAVYRDTKLRAPVDEKIARALIGEGQREPKNQSLNEVVEVVEAVGKAKEESVVRRLLTSLGRDLGAQLVVLVKPAEKGPPVARVLRVQDQRFMSVTLTSRESATPDGQKTSGWKDAVVLLRGIVGGSAAPGPRAAKPKPGPKPGAAAKPLPAGEAEGEPEDGFNLFESPWFWGGVGVVAAVGITVLVLSQTALNEPGTIRLEGRVSP